MTSESQDNIEKDDNESRGEHIRQRLKELGVSEQSERPKPSFLSKYGKYFFIAIIAVLVAAYWFEYSKQTNSEEQQLADATAPTGTVPQQQQAGPYGYPVMQPPAWVQERRAQMPQPPEPPEWVKERRAQMPQRPEPPAWVQERHAAWMQQSPMMQNVPGNSGDNSENSGNNQATNNPYYAQRYPSYPNPYWQNNPGYYPGYGYGQWPAYPVPYYGGYPYYNGW